MTAMRALRGFTGDVLILSGDVPLITAATIKGLVRIHRRGGAKRPVLSLITAVLEDPSGYGRVLRDSGGAVSGVVEHRDATTAERAVREINTGIYLIDSGFLRKNIKKLGAANAQGEYYLPDLVGMAVAEGRRVAALTCLDTDEVMGVNNRVELARASRLMRRRTNEALMLSGVTMTDPEATYIDSGVRVGADTVIGPGAHLKGRTVVGSGCVIEEGAVVRDSNVGDGTTIRSLSVIEESVVGSAVIAGPFARLRPGTIMKDESKAGNFVEIKNSVIGHGSKVSHLTYIGDTDMGEGVNVGAGTITCNYDGVKKHRTVIEDGAFIGSDSQLVAPVTVGRGAYVGSGTTVTKDVPPYSLVISRAEERVMEDWVLAKGLAGNKARKKKGRKKG
jgi:bifunctional UDP-N-acetylglucosamine pyrophosphorylase/glucosamine-1-phosphate N-acetyltransferase